MNEPNDKPLHDWVRQTLDPYRPAYEPQDWVRLQHGLRRRRWWKRIAMGGAGLLFLAFIGWLIWPAPTHWPPGKRPQATPSAGKIEPSLPISPVKAFTEPVRERPDVPVRKTTIRSRQEILPERPALSDNLRIAPVPVRDIPVNLPAARPSIPVIYSLEEAAIQQQMLTGHFGPDSTSFKVLTRNLRQWPDAVVVCDLTTSMYPYSTQIFAWLRQNARHPAIKGFVFFTDCDSLGRETQPGGPAGQMFVTNDKRIDHVLPLMLRAARNTVQNTDDAENDVEALLFAQKFFPEARHLILLADNLNPVKDIDRLDGVRKPVHVVLCGAAETPAKPFQQNHFEIAVQTKGSLHTIEDDLNPNVIRPHTVIRVGPHYYRYHARRKQFRLTRFSRRPFHLFGPFWL